MLPFAWQHVPASASTAEICRRFGLPPGLALHGRLAELDDEFKRACAGINDSRTIDALRALGDKLSVLAEAVLAQGPLPDAQAVEVSADGAGFETPEPLEVGVTLGVHLVLPVSYHVVCRARVTHCVPRDGAGFQVGVEFQDLDASTGRRLTRYAIGRDRET